MTAVVRSHPRHLFERVMFWAMVPGMVVPILAAIEIFRVREAQDMGGGHGFFILPAVFATVLLWVLLGSMILRTWFWLRHPSVLSSARLPGASAVIHAAIYVLLIVWPITFRFPGMYLVSILIGVALAALPIFDHAILRTRVSVPASPITGARPRFVVGLPWILAAATAIALGAVVVGAASGSGTVASIGNMALGALGLPWSYVAATITTVFTSGAVIPDVVGLVALGVIAIVNVVVVWHATRSDEAYRRAVNWFFRLKPPVEAPPTP